MLQNYKQSGDSLQAGINVPISQPLIRHCTYNKVTVTNFLSYFNLQLCIIQIGVSQYNVIDNNRDINNHDDWYYVYTNNNLVP